MAEFREETHHGEAVAEGSSQRTWDETNLKGVAPAMRNEHGTDRKRLPVFTGSALSLQGCGLRLCCADTTGRWLWRSWRFTRNQASLGNSRLRLTTCR